MHLNETPITIDMKIQFDSNKVEEEIKGLKPIDEDDIGEYTISLYSMKLARYKCVVRDELDEIVLYCDHIAMPAGYAKIAMVVKDSGIKSQLVLELYAYLLDYYEEVVSDTVQTAGGKSIWYKLFDKYKDSKSVNIGSINLTTNKKTLYDHKESYKDWKLKIFNDSYNKNGSHEVAMYIGLN